MWKITKRLVWQILSLVVLGVAVSLIAAWIQNNLLQNSFTPLPVVLIVVITVTAIILLAWKESRDEGAHSDDKRDLTREQRNRAAMLAKVRNFWVTGVLEQSLHGAALIELGKEYKPDAVHYPWTSVLQRREQPDKSLPSGLKTIEVFDGVGGELLILGEPGSGKTTMLLDLARDLIARGEQDEKLPIPVVFNLSSWAEKRPPLADWLAEELNFRYDVPKKIAAAWVKEDAVLPLLDGLDEVKLEHRAACVEAINRFRQDHGLLPTVVCSRIKEYEALTALLRLQAAIVLQQLLPGQIDNYLEKAGEQLASVRVLLQRDAVLRELVESPLMLSITALTYRGTSIESLPELTTVEAQRKHLFETYVARMFERRGGDKLYAPSQVIPWLAWLARRLVEHDQTTFYLEHMQPSWLQSQSQRSLYRTVISLMIGLVSGLIFGPAIGLLAGLSGGSVLAIVLGLVFGFGVGVVCGLSTGLFFGLFFRLKNSSEVKEIKTIETLHWSWSKLKDQQLPVMLGVLIIGLFSGGCGWLFGGPDKGVFIGLLFALAMGLLMELASGLEIGTGIETKFKPNQGMWRSAQNALLSGLVGSVYSGLGFGLVIELISGLGSGLNGGLVFGLCFGLAGILLVGGLSCIQHAALRFVLYRARFIPLNYVRFLDYCAERIFLRKVGGGYIFVHRLLMEYFAERGLESLRG